MANHDVSGREAGNGAIRRAARANDPIDDAVSDLLTTAARLWAAFAPDVNRDGEWIHQTEIASTVDKPFLQMAERAWDEVCGR